MNSWYLIAFPAWCILVLTAGARLADMGRDQWALTDHVRRLGMIGVAVAAASMLVTPFAEDGWLYGESTWRGTLLAWSWAFVWITTPGMPPWWDFILGVHRRTELWKGMGLRARLRGEWRALRASFKPRRYREPMAGPQGPLP